MEVEEGETPKAVSSISNNGFILIFNARKKKPNWNCEWFFWIEIHLAVWWDLTWQTLKVYLETIMPRHICFHLPTALINGEVGLNRRSVLDRSLHLLLRITRTFVLPCRVVFFYYTILFPLVSCIMYHMKLDRRMEFWFIFNYLYICLKFSAFAGHSGSISHIQKYT